MSDCRYRPIVAERTQEFTGRPGESHTTALPIRVACAVVHADAVLQAARPISAFRAGLIAIPSHES